MLYNGLGRYGAALIEAQQAAAEQPEVFSASWALPELIEAASRSGQAALATDAFAQLADAVSASHTDWGYGLHSRCQALVTNGEDADRYYREAVAQLSRTDTRPHVARAHLLYGEWLRREGRRADAQAQSSLRPLHHDRNGSVRQSNSPGVDGNRICRRPTSDQAS